MTGVKTALIAHRWEDLLHLAGLLKLGTVQAPGLIRTLQANKGPDQAGLPVARNQVGSRRMPTIAASLKLVASGLSPPATAHQLGLGRSTVHREISGAWTAQAFLKQNGR